MRRDPAVAVVDLLAVIGRNGKLIIKLGVSLFLILAFVTAYANWQILSYSQYIQREPAELLPSKLALVFGGGMNADGTQSRMQEDRVRTGVELFKMGKVEQLMMTGDDGAFRNDEVDAMRALAIELGVPTSSILVDPHGYRTYESCYREKNVYGITSVVAVSQEFHLPRIAYLCSNLGVSVLGVAADKRDYGGDEWRVNIREVLARVKGWWQITFTKPLPRSLEK